MNINKVLATTAGETTRRGCDYRGKNKREPLMPIIGRKKRGKRGFRIPGPGKTTLISEGGLSLMKGIRPPVRTGRVGRKGYLYKGREKLSLSRHVLCHAHGCD